MADKVNTGQRRSTSPLTKASFVNDLVDVVNDYRSQRTGPRPGKPIHNTPSTDCVKIKNLAGANLPRGSVVQLGEYLLSQLDPRKLFFEGNTVAEPVELGYAVLRQPIIAGAIGWAQVSGVCTALIDISEETDRFAVPVAGEHFLESVAGGPIEILSPAITESGSSESLTELVVRLGSGPTIVLGKTRGASFKDDFGTLELFAGEHGSEVRTGKLIEVFNRYHDLENWVWAHAARTGSGWDLIAGDCEGLGDEESSSPGESDSS